MPGWDRMAVMTGYEPEALSYVTAVPLLRPKMVAALSASVFEADMAIPEASAVARIRFFVVVVIIVFMAAIL